MIALTPAFLKICVTPAILFKYLQDTCSPLWLGSLQVTASGKWHTHFYMPHIIWQVPCFPHSYSSAIIEGNKLVWGYVDLKKRNITRVNGIAFIKSLSKYNQLWIIHPILLSDSLHNNDVHSKCYTTTECYISVEWTTHSKCIFLIKESLHMSLHNNIYELVKFHGIWVKFSWETVSSKFWVWSKTLVLGSLWDSLCVCNRVRFVLIYV